MLRIVLVTWMLLSRATATARPTWPLSRIHALLGIRASMHTIFNPLDFIAKLASLAPKPRANLTQFHGVFVGVPHHPNSKHRFQVTPARRGKGRQKVKEHDNTPEERRTARLAELLLSPI